MNHIAKTTALCIALLLSATSVQARADGAVIRTLTHNNPEHRGASARVFDDKVQLKWRKEQVRDWYVYHAPGYITDPKKMCFERPNSAVVDRRQNEHTISGLNKGRIYTFMVVAHYVNKTAPPQNSHCDYVYHAYAVVGRTDSAGTIRNLNPGNKGTKFHLGLDAVNLQWSKPKGDVTGYKLIYAEKSWKAWQMCTFDFPSVQLDANARSHTVANLKRKQHYTFMVTAQFRNRTQDCAHLFFAAGNTNKVQVRTTEHRNPKQVNVETKIVDDKATLKWYDDKPRKWHIYWMPGFVNDVKKICTERPNVVIIDGKRHEYTISGLTKHQPYTVVIEPEHGGDRLPPQINSHCEYVYHRSFVAGAPESDLRVTNINPGNQNTSAKPGDGSVRFTWRKPSDSRKLTGYRILYVEGDINPMQMCSSGEAPSFRLGTADATGHTLLGLKKSAKYTFMVVAEFDYRRRDCDYIYFGTAATREIKVTSSRHLNPDHHDTKVTIIRTTARLEWRKESTDVQRFYVYHKPGYVADAKEMCTERPNAEYVASNRNSHTIEGLKRHQIYTILVEAEHKNAKLQSGLRTHCDYVYHIFAIGGIHKSAGRIRGINPGNKGGSIKVGDSSARLTWRKPGGDVRGYQVIYEEGIWKPWEMCIYRYKRTKFRTTDYALGTHEHTVDGLQDKHDYTFMVTAKFVGRPQGCEYILYGSGKAQKPVVTSASHKNPDHTDARVEPNAQGDVARVVWPYKRERVKRWHIYHTEGYVTDPKKICTDRPNQETASPNQGADHYLIDLRKGKRYTVLVEAEYASTPLRRTHCDYVFHQFFTAGDPNSSLRMRNLNPNTDNVTLQTGDRAARLLWKQPRKDAIGYRFRVRTGKHNAFTMCTEKVDVEKRMDANRDAKDLEYVLRDEPLLMNDKHTYTVMIVAELRGQERDCNYVYNGTFAPHRPIVRGSTHNNPEHDGNSVQMKSSSLAQLRWRNDKNVRRWHIYHTEGVITDLNKLCTERPNPATIPGDEFAHTVTNLRAGEYYTFLVEMEYGGDHLPAEFRKHCNYTYLVHAIAGKPKSPFRIRDFTKAKGAEGADNVQVLTGDGVIRHQFRSPREDVVAYRYAIRPGSKTREEMCKIITDTKWKVPTYSIKGDVIVEWGTELKNKIRGIDTRKFYYTRDTHRKNGTRNTAMFSAVIKSYENDCNYFHYAEVTPNKARVRTAEHLNPSHRNSEAKPAKGTIELRWDNPIGEVDWKWHIYYAPGKHTDAKQFCTERANAIVEDGYTDRRTITRLKSGVTYTFMVEAQKGESASASRDEPPPPPPQFNTHCNYVLHMQATPK